MEPLERLVDVETVRVVRLDELPELGDKIEAGGVTAGARLELVADLPDQTLGLGPLATRQPRRERVEVDRVQVDVPVVLGTFGGGADHVLLGADRAIEQLADRARHRRHVRGLVERTDPLGEIARHGHQPRVWRGGGVRQDRGEEPADSVGSLEVRAARGRGLRHRCRHDRHRPSRELGSVLNHR